MSNNKVPCKLFLQDVIGCLTDSDPLKNCNLFIKTYKKYCGELPLGVRVTPVPTEHHKVQPSLR
jgi:hypothetical protein